MGSSAPSSSPDARWARPGCSIASRAARRAVRRGVHRARQHVPSCSVVELAKLLQQHHADTIISFGGGSPIDTAKAAVYTLLGRQPRPAGAKPPAHIAIPTTLSAGEFTAVAGITDEKTRIKRPVSDSRITPRTVIADPTLTLETPAWLWAASGIRALDHAIESIYSVRHYPVSDAAASSGLTMLLQHLRPSLDTAAPVCSSTGASVSWRRGCACSA